MKEEIARLYNVSDKLLGKEAEAVMELGHTLKALDPIDEEVTKLRSDMGTYGQSTEKFGKPHFLRVVKEFLSYQAAGELNTTINQ